MKGANLATLYRIVEGRYQYPGFMVPVSAYFHFIETRGFNVDLGQGRSFHT